MKIELSVVATKNYLLVKLLGVYKLDRSFPKLNAIKDECEKHQINRILIDMLDADFSEIPVMDRFLLAEAIPKIFGQGMKAAFVADLNHVTKFMETVAVNRGAHVLLFESIKSAEEWLSEI